MGDGGATPVNLQYQFYKPTSTRIQYHWSHFKWSDCSKTCGEGLFTNQFVGIVDAVRRKMSLCMSKGFFLGVTSSY